MAPVIAVVDYQVGNMQSVVAALRRAGASVVVTSDADTIRRASAVVLPGVGSFTVAMQRLEVLGLPDVLRERARAGVPLLGICLGMQLLLESGVEGAPGEPGGLVRSAELRGTPGLAILPGVSRKIPTDAKLPHMGWNQLRLTNPHRATVNLHDDDEMYFVHSYYADCPASVVIAETEYGGVRIPAIIGRDNVVGCQFHPEKSSKIGQLVIQAFVAMK